MGSTNLVRSAPGAGRPPHGGGAAASWDRCGAGTDNGCRIRTLSNEKRSTCNLPMF